MRILRFPWTNTLIETLHSRIFELYIAQEYPTQHLDYLGRDFPLSTEDKDPQSDYKESIFTGLLTENPFRFLNQMSDISNFIGIQIGDNGSTAHKELGIRQLFQSETFCRELRANHIGCRDSDTKKFLDDHEIPSTLIGCVSSLLGQIEIKPQENHSHTEILFIDLEKVIEKSILKSIDVDKKYTSISTKILEVSGEFHKTTMVDQIITQLHTSKVVITSNIDLAIPAVALGKRTLLVQDRTDVIVPLSDFVTTINASRITGGMSWSEIDKLLDSAPSNSVNQMASEVKVFIAKALGEAPRLRSKLNVDLYKEQVLSEVINSQLTRIKSLEVIEEQMDGLLGSRSWKLTSPLRRFSDLPRRYR